jgi:hypothetical protein
MPVFDWQWSGDRSVNQWPPHRGGVMKRIASIIITGIFAIMTCVSLLPASAHAQGGAGLEAKIAFPFTINNQHFDAGDYQFDYPHDSFLLRVHNSRTCTTRFIDVRPGGDSASGADGGLTFRHEGSHYILTAIRFSRTDSYSVLVRPGSPDSEPSMYASVKAQR